MWRIKLYENERENTSERVTVKNIGNVSLVMSISWLLLPKPLNKINVKYRYGD